MDQPIWVSHFSAVGLSPRLGAVDLRFGRMTVLCGDLAPALLRVLGREVAGNPDELRAGSTCVEMSGQPVKTLSISESLCGAERAALHAAWIEEFRRRRNRGGQRSALLRQAWQYLWGNSCERLWAAPGTPPFVASAAIEPRFLSSEEEAPRRMPPDLLALDSRGSGYLAAFDLLGQAALQEPDLVLVEKPNPSLHPLIWRRMVWALGMAAPGAQVIGAAYDPVFASAPTVLRVGDCAGQAP